MVRIVLGVCLVTIGAGQARADHFAIDLKVQAGKESKTAKTEMAALGVKEKKREVLHAKVGDRITVKWTMTNTHAKKVVKNVRVYFFAAKVDDIGLRRPDQKAIDKGAVVQNAFEMDFNPKDKTQGELSFMINAAGSYQFRLETLGAATGENEHEHFAALDVIIKGDEK